MRSLRPCGDSSATPSFPSQPEGKIGLPRANPRGGLRSRVYPLPATRWSWQSTQLSSLGYPRERCFAHGSAHASVLLSQCAPPCPCVHPAVPYVRISVPLCTHVHLYHLSMPAKAGDIKDMGLIPVSGRPLEEGMATLSSILSWEIPWTEEPGRLQSMGSHT